jgi:hypothetical protein
MKGKRDAAWAIDLSLEGRSSTMIDAAIVEGWRARPAPKHDAWSLAATIAAIKSEVW